MLKEDGILKQLIKGLQERALQTELKDHLGYDKYSRSNSSDNIRNGVIKIDIPRDRQGEFEPTLVPKHAIRIDRLAIIACHILKLICSLNTYMWLIREVK